MTKPKIYDFAGDIESEFEFSCRYSTSTFKHASRVQRHERIRTAACREHEYRKNGDHHEKNLRRVERF